MNELLVIVSQRMLVRFTGPRYLTNTVSAPVEAQKRRTARVNNADGQELTFRVMVALPNRDVNEGSARIARDANSESNYS